MLGPRVSEAEMADAASQPGGLSLSRWGCLYTWEDFEQGCSSCLITISACCGAIVTPPLTWGALEA